MTAGWGGRRTVVAGVDVSLTSTRIAQAIWQPPTQVMSPAVTVLDMPQADDAATLQARHGRLTMLRRAITDVAAGADLVVLLGGPPRGWTGAPHDWSGLWWSVVDVLTDEFGSVVVEVPYAAAAKYATGNGRSPLVAVRAAAGRRYPEWDAPAPAGMAVLLAAMGARHLGRPVDKVPPLAMAGMTKVRWPAARG